LVEDEEVVVVIPATTPSWISLLLPLLVPLLEGVVGACCVPGTGMGAEIGCMIGSDVGIQEDGQS